MKGTAEFLAYVIITVVISVAIEISMHFFGHEHVVQWVLALIFTELAFIERRRRK